MRRFLFGIGAMVLLAAAAVAGLLVLARQTEMAEVATPAPASFDRGVVARGAQLALIGNCNTCHTAPEGKTFAGGRALPTPFGTIHATNITPDPDTGIGRWSEEAFRRSLREGVRRDGAHLYPAFPYDHFTKATDEDIAALYAYLMTREPVRAAAPANDLVFPLNIRATVAGWKLLFLQPGAYRPDPARDAAWNRGKYLTDGLAHCGACHTPRNVLGAEKQDRYLAGGSAEGWHAPALNAQSPAPVPWDADSLFAYLRDGFERHHGAAAGPMAPVGHNLAQATEQDVRAIAGYVASLIGPPPERRRSAEDVLAQLNGPGGAPRGERVDASDRPGGDAAAIFAGACAGCHAPTQASGAGGGINLALSTDVAGPDPRNALRVIIGGLAPPEEARGPFMPPFGDTFTDRQIAELAAYLRGRFSRAPPWSDLEDHVRRIRRGDGNS